MVGITIPVVIYGHGGSERVSNLTDVTQQNPHVTCKVFFFFFLNSKRNAVTESFCRREYFGRMLSLGSHTQVVICL